eukprot:6178202-Pleurochrysis_carterae.AAC.1
MIQEGAHPYHLDCAISDAARSGRSWMKHQGQSSEGARHGVRLNSGPSPSKKRLRRAQPLRAVYIERVIRPCFPSDLSEESGCDIVRRQQPSDARSD